MLIEFSRWDCDDYQSYSVDPLEVICVREYRARRAYGGETEVSEIVLGTGDKIRVSGHVSEKIKAYHKGIA